MSVALFFALYCLEAGLFFLVVPWTRLWTLNPLLHSSAAMTLIAANPFVRGFVSGFGLVHLLIGIRRPHAHHNRTRVRKYELAPSLFSTTVEPIPAGPGAETQRLLT